MTTRGTIARMLESGSQRSGQLDWTLSGDGKTILAQHCVTGTNAGEIDIDTMTITPSAERFRPSLNAIVADIVATGQKYEKDMRLANLKQWPLRNQAEIARLEAR